MYYVYSGYISPDNCDGERLTHELRSFVTKREVLKYYEEFSSSINNECLYVCFTVIDGEEREVRPVEFVTKFELK